jgi:hypothetical protein
MWGRANIPISTPPNTHANTIKVTPAALTGDLHAGLRFVVFDQLAGHVDRHPPDRADQADETVAPPGPLLALTG